MQLSGIILGLATFLCIGVFHPIVIKCEYRFSYRIWPVFLAGGLVFLVLSALVEQIVVSSILGVIGFSCLWSILELFEQHKRVERGWFPANPRHHGSAAAKSEGDAQGASRRSEDVPAEAD